MEKTFKRCLSVFLVVVMLCSMFGVSVSAAVNTVTLKGGSRKLNGEIYTATLNETLLNLSGNTYTDENGVVYTIDKENHTVTFTTEDTGYFYFPEHFFVLEGHEQVGWCNSGTSNSGSYVTGRRLKITSDKTYYARYNTAKYTVEFLSGEFGEGTSQTISNKTYGQSVTLPNAIFTRSGYVQMGWATTENSDVIEYELGGDFTIFGNIQFYPVWIKPVYDFDMEYNVVNFGSVCENYTSTQSFEIAITNNSNVPVSYVVPQSESYYVEFSSLSAQIGEQTTISISPKSNLDIGVYNEQISIGVGEESSQVCVDVNFVVRNHNYIDWTQTIPATSDAPGMLEKYCQYCGIGEKQAIPQLLCDMPVIKEATFAESNITVCWDSVFGADSYIVYKKNENGEWVSLATVGADTLSYVDSHILIGEISVFYTVSALNEVGESLKNEEGTEVHYVIHDFGEWQERTPATCLTDGEMYRECSICEKEETKVIPSFGGHIFPDEWECVVEHSCTTDGEYYRVCNNCDEKETKNITAQGHNYSLVSTIDGHPHAKIYVCMNCADEKQEPVFDSDCDSCIYDTVILDDGNIEIVGYNGTDVEIDVPSEIDGKKVVSISADCFQGNGDVVYVALPDSVTIVEDNTFKGCSALQSVGLSKNVTAIGENAFSGCTVLAGIALYPGVVSIGKGAFDGFRGVINCVRNSYAHNYVVENNLNYELMDILAKDNTRIDYTEKVIFTSVSVCDDIGSIIEYFGDVEAIATTRNPLQKDFYGTGSVISVFAGDEYLGDYVVIVEGDVNGDSVCDALDMFETARMSSGKAEASQEQIYAANGEISDYIDMTSYQNVVNKAMA